MTMDLQIKRAYEPCSSGDGERYLVDRLWPRGVKKEKLALAGLLKDLAPSEKLRISFGHDSARWSAFHRNHRAELDARPEVLSPLREALGGGAVVTPIYSARDEAHNQAVVLREYLLESNKSLRRSQPRTRARYES